MKFKKADTRTLWVFAIVAVFILAIILTGVWKKIGFFITFANFFGFEQIAPPGTSILGVNMDGDDLRFFTGEKWVKIKDDTEFVLDVYKFKPEEIKKALLAFYRDTPRKPEIFSLDVNRWSYWDAKVSSSRVTVYDEENVYSKDYFVEIDNKIKNGYEGPLETEFGLGHSNALKEAFTNLNKNRRQFDGNFLNSYYSQPLSKVISWRDSILEGGSCEKFALLKLKFETSPLSFKQDSNYPENYFYNVQKIEEYLVVDLSKPVEAEKEEKYRDGCFKTEYFKDIDRIDSMNPTEIKIKFVDKTSSMMNDIDTIIKWAKFGGRSFFSWGYSVYMLEQTTSSSIKSIESTTQSLKDTAEFGDVSEAGNRRANKLFWIPDGKDEDFYDGLAVLTRQSISSDKLTPFNRRNDEASEIHVFINPTGEIPSKYQEINLDNILITNTEPWFDTSRGFNNNLFAINKFVFTILDEYNKYLKIPGISLTTDLTTLPNYFFLFKDNSLILVDKLGLGQNIEVLSGKIIVGTQILGEINSKEIISINYSPNIISVGQFPIVDFLNKKNLFDLTYGIDPTSLLGYSMLSKEAIPSKILGDLESS